MIERRCHWLVTLVGWLTFAPTVVGDDRGQLLATALDGNRAAIQAIVTMECRYERIQWADTTREQAKEWFTLTSAPGGYWRSGDFYRLTEPRDWSEMPPNYLVRNREIFGWPQGFRYPLTLRKLESEYAAGGEMWQYLLFRPGGRTAPSFLPLEDIVQQPEILKTVERIQTPSNEIHIDLLHSGGRLELWFSPKANYLIRKCVSTSSNRAFQWDHEVIEFAKPAPAIFVPIVIEHRCSIYGDRKAVIRTLVSEVTVNQPLTADAFRLPDIAGRICDDYVSNASYAVDADGNPVGPQTELLPVRPADSVRPPTAPPTAWQDYLKFALAVAAATGIVIAVLYLRKSKSR
jgi:hypothetical protein